MFHIFCIFLLTFQFNVNVFCFLGLCLGCYFLSGLLNWRVTCSRPGEVSRSLYVSCCLFLDFWVSDKSCYYDSLYSYTKNYVVLVWSDTTELTKTPIDINVTIGTVINSHQGHMSDIIRPMFRTRRIHIYLSNTFISFERNEYYLCSRLFSKLPFWFSEQVVIFYIGNIPSKYYKVFGDRDMAGFREKTIMAVLLITAEAFVSFDWNYFLKDKIRQYIW